MILKEPDDYATLHEQIIAGDKPATGPPYLPDI